MIPRASDLSGRFDRNSRAETTATRGQISPDAQLPMHLSSLREPSFPSDLLIGRRFDASDLTRAGSNPSLCKPVDLPITASLPSPPMSGSPPPPSPPDISRTASLRRKRSPSDHAQTGFALERTAYESIARSHEFQPRYAGEIPSQIPTFPGPFQQGFGGGYVPSASNIGLHSSVYPLVGQTLLSQPDVPGPPRATRKLKAHVASACVNCKKKHLRCDNARPCNRCVQSGKEHTCIDVTHKKRGRPPLKVDGGQVRRPYETSIGPLNIPNVSAQGLIPSHFTQPGAGTNSRDALPLPSPGAPENRRRPPPLFEAPSYAIGHVTPSANHPLSTESSLSSNKPPSPYYTSPSLQSSSESQMPQSRFDHYGRAYPPAPGRYSTLAPTSTRESPQLRQYQSFTSISSSTPAPLGRPIPPPFIAPEPSQPSNPASSSIQLPPIQPSLHGAASMPGPPRMTGSSHVDRREGNSSTYQTNSLPQQQHQTEDSSHDLKRQRMDLGGMLRRSET